MLLTGWMSGGQFRPEPLNNLNIYTDPLAQMWEIKYVRYFVGRFKDEQAITAWGLGNESNVMSTCSSREAAYTWSSLIANTIRSADVSRPVISGMHGLCLESPTNPWYIVDQGEACDIVTTHPYPLFTHGCDIDHLCDLRSSLHAAAESCLYSDIAKRPCLVEEMGDLGGGIVSQENSKTYFEMVLWSCWSHNRLGCNWWQAFDVPATHQPTYDWYPMESPLGLFDINRVPKRTAGALADFSKMLGSLPPEFRVLPPISKKAVCILSHSQDHWAVAYTTFVLAKQAGFTVQFIGPDDCPPAAQLYIIPSLAGYDSLSQTQWHRLRERIRDEGGVLYVSVSNAVLPDLNELAGIEITGRHRTPGGIEMKFINGSRLKISDSPAGQYQLNVSPCSAQVLAVDNLGSPMLTSSKLGNGIVFFMNTGFESVLASKCGAFGKDAPDFSSVYRLIGENIINSSVCKKDDVARSLLLTEHECADSSVIITGVNHDCETLKTVVRHGNSPTVRVLYGEAESVSDGLRVLLAPGKGFVAQFRKR
jgi:hypothetical protein